MSSSPLVEVGALIAGTDGIAGIGGIAGTTSVGTDGIIGDGTAGGIHGDSIPGIDGATTGGLVFVHKEVSLAVAGPVMVAGLEIEP